MQYKISECLTRCLSGENDNYAITTDIWSSRALDSYLSTTLHFADGFDRKLAILRCFPYNSKHSGESIKAQIKMIIADWNLPPEPVAIVRDAGSNVTKAFLDMNGVTCFPHTLGRVVHHSTLVQAGFKRLNTKSKKLVKRLRTPTGKCILTDAQKNEQRRPRSLLQSNKTRWNSTYMMFDRLHQEKSPVTTAQAHQDLKILPSNQLSPTDWDLIMKSIKILKPFLDTTNESEGDHSLLSEVIPMVTMLKKEIGRINEVGVGTMKREALQQLDKYFVRGNWRHYPAIETDPLYSKSTILDPRFKMAGFHNKTFAVLAKTSVIQEISEKLMSNSTVTDVIPEEENTDDSPGTVVINSLTDFV